MVMTLNLGFLLLVKPAKWLFVPLSSLTLLTLMLYSCLPLQPDYFIHLAGVNLFFSPLLMVLSLWSVTAAFIVSGSSGAYSSKMGATKIFVTLMAFLLIFFSTSSLITLYLSFEASLIPILFLVLGWGYQPERLYAGLSMLFYTMIASIPFLLSAILLVRSSNSVSPLLFNAVSQLTNHSPSTMIILSLSLGFLVKLPVFWGHLWLPRAHVEAPMEGSMMLAAIMLKLGGYGVFQVVPYLSLSPLTLHALKNFSLLGGMLVSFTCLRQTDLKTLIAYSSVAHMAMAVAASLSGKILSLWAASVAYLSHGFISSGLFMGANYMYIRSGTRNLSLLSSSLSFVPMFSALWFLLCLGNMGAPPSPNLVGEIFLISSILSQSLLSSIPLGLMAILATAFTLNLFMATQHLQSSNTKKVYISLTIYELITLLIHAWPAVGGATLMFCVL